jgi:soluble lytic murein transglycosylase-like protein
VAHRGSVWGRTLGATGAACAAACLLAGVPARADVIEIAPDGQITTVTGPAVFTDAGVKPITPQRAAPGPVSLSRAPSPMGLPHPIVAGHLDAAAARYRVDPSLVRAVAWQESRFRTNAVSRKGAIGVMQLMPDTARDLGVDPYDVQQNIAGGVAYLSAQLARFGGDVRLALAAYNAGPEAVARHKGVPPFRETQNYVRSIAARLNPAP